MSRYELLVIGSGPAGQSAAIEAARAGRSVVMIERSRRLGGQCVFRGTIPSKTLRETALQIARMRVTTSTVVIKLAEDTEVRALMDRLHDVIDAHTGFLSAALREAGVEIVRGLASFAGPHEIRVTDVDGSEQILEADHILLGTGSLPRDPPEVEVDHEHILDSDSILSLEYLPRTLTVLGGGVIACEYATILSHLGVDVTVVDRAPRPLGFIDEEIVDRFVDEARSHGLQFVGNATVEHAWWDGLEVVTRLTDGREIRSEKCLVALGRVPNTRALGLEQLPVVTTRRGHVVVDEHGRSSVPHVYAAGDLVGAPALATTSMEQGRRAARHALDLPVPAESPMVPVGIYTIPAIASVGLTEEQAVTQTGGATVGRAHYDEVARGWISGSIDGMLKLVCSADGSKLLGVHITGEGAAELVHIGQMALLHGAGPEAFIEQVFNFPTFAEAYRIAALDLVSRGVDEPILRPLETA